MIDGLVLIVFVAWSIGNGLHDRRAASRDPTSYFLAGRSLGAWESGFSMAATQYSADTPMLAAGLVATGGVFALWRLWSYGLAFLLLGFLLGTAWWRSGVVTDAEFCELRYSGRPAAILRAVKAVYFGVAFNCAALAMVLVAAVRVAEPFLTWGDWLPAPVLHAVERIVVLLDFTLTADPDPVGRVALTASNLISVCAIFGFTLLYSATGGLRSVTRTDVAQIALVFLATLLYGAFAVAAIGGLWALPARLSDVVGPERSAILLSFDPRNAVDASGTFLAVLGLQWALQSTSDGTGYLAQRCMACRSEAEARRAPVIFAFAQILGRTLLWLPLLVALLVLFPLSEGQSIAEREVAFVRGIDLLLPPGVRGLMLVGMLAALASTLDTHLNWGASYLTNDLYARFFAPRVLGREAGPRELVWVARACSPLLLVASLLVMTRLGSIQAAWHLTLALGAGLGVPLLARWIWRRANAWGELSAIVASCLASVVLIRSTMPEGARLLVIGAVGGLATIVGSLATRSEPDEHLAAFYARVRPPGFWGRSEARRALGRGLACTFAAALTLYGLLVGLGTWLIGAPPPLEVPRSTFIAGSLVVAIAAIPVWLVALRSPDSPPDSGPQPVDDSDPGSRRP